MQYLKQYGEQLVALGYTVLPIRPGTKRPDLKNWPNHETTAADVVAWYSNGRAAHGAGINARNAPAIDVDVLDAEVAQQMSDAIDAIFPGERLMTRTGLAPKFLVPFRSDTPFRKMTSHVYTDGKNEHKVEILGDGQQWVAYHVHPDTDRPYEWWDGLGNGGILDVQCSELPVLTRSDAQRVIDAFEVFAADRVLAGRWRVKTQEPGRDTTVSQTESDPFSGFAQPTDLTPVQVEWVVSNIRNDEDDYDRWFSVLCAVHHQLGDGGIELARAYSQKSSKHVDETFEAKYASLGAYKGPMATLRSFLKETGQPPPNVIAKRVQGEFVRASQFMSAQKIEWHIKHVIPKRGLVVVYGAPGSSKSFFALDMVAHVARGLPWRGHRTRQSSVAYIAAEGVAGFGNRLAAYAKHNDLDMDVVPLFVRGGAFLLKSETAGLIEQIQALPEIGLVVIDTLSAVTPGANENTSEDMGLAISAAQLVIEATGATVILIHHTNKNGDMRGWSGLLGAVDNQIRIERKDDVRTAHVEKQKEGEDGKEYGYRLKVVDLYEDEDGDMVTSCVVLESEETTPNTRGATKERKPRSGDFETSRNYDKARHFLRVIQDMCGLETGVSLQEDEVIEAIQKDPIVNPMAEPDWPLKKNIIPTLRTLCQLGKITKEGRNIRLC